MKLPGIEEAEAWDANQILTPGEHLIEVDDAEEGKSSGGYPEIRLTLKGVGPSAGGGIRDWQVVTEGSMGKVAQILDAFGIARSEDFDPAVLKGRRAAVYVNRVQKRNGQPGEMVSEVASYKPAKEFSGTAGAGAGGNGGDPGPDPFKPAAGQEPDDIPF